MDCFCELNENDLMLIQGGASSAKNKEALKKLGNYVAGGAATIAGVYFAMNPVTIALSPIVFDFAFNCFT